MRDPVIDAGDVLVFEGDCLDVLAEMPDNSIDAIVTDPPYGLGFMGKAWDDLPPGEPWARECLRVLKPGGHLLAFGGSRTWHRLAVAIEDAGFEVRDSIAWLYGSGFPKSLDVSKAIDKAAGAEREVISEGASGVGTSTVSALGNGLNVNFQPRPITAPATPAALQWQGWGTALKPAFEPIVVARKPLTGTVAANVLAHGTGALNIDGCRVGTTVETWPSSRGPNTRASMAGGIMAQTETGTAPAGRWPANVVLDESQATALDEQTGAIPPSQRTAKRDYTARDGIDGHLRGVEIAEGRQWGYDDSGGASRFFYVAKAPTRERPSYIKEGESTLFASSIRKRCVKCGKQEVNVGRSACACEAPDFQPDPSMQNKVSHPTVKPLALMRWLVRLVTPPGGTVLDTFAGSGATLEAARLEGFDSIGIEREADYLPLIEVRLDRTEGAE